MTARQHLTGLERDGLVQTEKVKRQTGRPHYLFSLTPKGEEMFPQRFDLFAQALLEEASCLTASEIDGLTRTPSAPCLSSAPPTDWRSGFVSRSRPHPGSNVSPPLRTSCN